MTENILGRTGGPYLDIEEAKAREVKSAQIEGREVDFSNENLFPAVGVVVPSVIIAVDTSDDTSIDLALAKLDEISFEAPSLEAPSLPPAEMTSSGAGIDVEPLADEERLSVGSEPGDDFWDMVDDA